MPGRQWKEVICGGDSAGENKVCRGSLFESICVDFRRFLLQNFLRDCLCDDDARAENLEGAGYLLASPCPERSSSLRVSEVLKRLETEGIKIRSGLRRHPGESFDV